MLTNYLKIALRSLRKHPGYACVNIIGLGLGIAAAVLILLYARNELTYDRFHRHADATYLVYKERVTPTGTQQTFDTWVPLLEKMEASFPAVAAGTRVYTEAAWVQYANQRFQEPVTYVDPAFFEVFTFPLIRGDPAAPLPDNNAAVISQDVARKYFGDADPIGRVFTLTGRQDYTVTGVLARVPQNTSVQPEIVVRITSSPDYQDLVDNWNSSFLDTYIRLAEGASTETLEDRFPAFVASIWDAEVASRTHFRLLPLLDLHDAATGNRRYAYILLAIAAATILIACINFVNLATARSLERAREIGMRKVLGAARRQLVVQFLGESVVMGLMALVLGVALAQLLLPLFNELYDLELALNLLRDPLVLPALLGLGLAAGLLSGGYPAVFLSRFRPAASLKGTFKTSRRGRHLRHSLVVIQFALSIVLIAGTGVMWSQIQYMKHRNLAFDQENILVLPVRLSDFADPEAAAGRLQTFKDELSRRSDVVAVTSSANVPGNWPGRFIMARPEGSDGEAPRRLRWAAMDAWFFDTYGIRFVEGRNFMEGSEADRRRTVILNEAALRDFGWTSAAGKTVRVGGNDFEVVGVVRDYHYESLLQAVAPVIHIYRPPDGGVHDFISIRIRPDDYAAMLAGIRALWKRLDPTRAFDYFFVDQNFDRLYRDQDRLVMAAGGFGVLAIWIACLGLFGLASLMVVQRTKEIGVRKVLGASVPRLVLLLSRDFTRLVGVAFVAAVPVAYFAMNRWLQDFAYHTEISWQVFLGAGLAALAVAWLTVGYQAVRAALADPVKSLRYE